MDDNIKTKEAAEHKDEAKKPKSRAKSGKSDKKPFSVTLGEYKGEFAKIIWPTRQELVKSSITVIITCAIFGVAIFIMDLVFNQGMGVFTRLIG